MTNEEFYKDDLLREIMIDTLGVNKETGKPAACSYMKCRECFFEPHDCNKGMEHWLQSEHIDEVDWSKVKVDTPIYVSNVTDSNDDKKWYPRHFAKFENGKVYTWIGGGTSFTTKKGEDSCYEWKYAKLAEN